MGVNFGYPFKWVKNAQPIVVMHVAIKSTKLNLLFVTTKNINNRMIVTQIYFEK